MYCAIIGDIIGSKALADRAGVQAKLQETLTQVNGRYEKDVYKRQEPQSHP